MTVISTLGDISGISASAKHQGGALLLPIRAEKRIIAVPDHTKSEQQVDSQVAAHVASGNPLMAKVAASLSSRFKNNNYIMIRLRGRGGQTPGVWDPTAMATYRFLTNPSEVQIRHQTVDAQAMSRAGMQIGVWGEDFVEITLTGKTPGKYYQGPKLWKNTQIGGITDYFTQYSASYRNLLALEMVVENNGYWYEGEAAGNQYSSSAKYIKMHQDVELIVGEFIWQGMFETMEVTEDADTPFLADFSLTFMAWRESYRTGTPYNNAIGGAAQFGHVPVRGAISVAQSLLPSATPTPLPTDSIVGRPGSN